MADGSPARPASTVPHPGFSAPAEPTRSTAAAEPAPTPAPPSAASDKLDPSAPLDVALPDGRVVTLQRPPVATQFEVYRILGAAYEGSPPVGLALTVKALMYVRAIDGRQQDRPTDIVEARELMNRLGDDGVELVANAYTQFFVLRATLPLSGR